jgi:hypothetical protein
MISKCSFTILGLMKNWPKLQILKMPGMVGGAWVRGAGCKGARELERELHRKSELEF